MYNCGVKYNEINLFKYYLRMLFWGNWKNPIVVDKHVEDIIKT
jgi:hypothetical protein